MKNVVRAVFTLLLVVSMVAIGAENIAKGPYDPTLDGIKQLKEASAQASKEGKRVLVIVGGNWCKWCRALEKLVLDDAAINQQLTANFVLVHLNFSKENKNPDAMARLGNPDKLGFPSLAVLSAEGKLLHTQETSSLETGDPKAPAHDPAKVLAFLQSMAK